MYHIGIGVEGSTLAFFVYLKICYDKYLMDSVENLMKIFSRKSIW